MAKTIILIVDTNQSNLELLAQQLAEEGYETLSAASLEELDKAIYGKRKISLGLIDLSGFDQSIWERCDQLREAKIPFLVISPRRSPSIQRDSMKHGASAVLTKPQGIKELLGHIQTMLSD